MTSFVVVGAGMAGLLAANMLRDRCLAVYESQASLPNNHHAVLRFRSSVVADTLNIPFQKVKVLKASAPWRNPVADALAYSKKTNGSYSLRSSTTTSGELQDRFIAPPDFIERMSNSLNCQISFDKKFIFGDTITPAISTIPMPALMKILGYESKVEFNHRAGVTIKAKIANCRAYCSLYVPDPMERFSRISITGEELMVECNYSEDLLEDEALRDRILFSATTLLGFTDRSDISNIEANSSKYAKILPIDEHERKKFIMWATENHNVYSVGRFATWRPGLLLDDVVHDVRVVQDLYRNQHNYDHRRRR